MSTTPLRLDIAEDAVEYLLPRRNWKWKKNDSDGSKGPLRLIRLCVLGAFLPAVLVAGPTYLRYRVYSEQFYPLAASDQRLIDRRVSTTWCQRQVVKVNGTFNAYLLKEVPKIEPETKLVSMTRHLVLEDDMKEYWGFYLLRGSSVTVSTCVRWPGASLTIIRGHKHLHECAFIGDDSSEELDELLQIAEERGLLNATTAELQLRIAQQGNEPGNVPDKMKRAREGVRFHDKNNAPAHHPNNSSSYNSLAAAGNSHELDANALRQILASLFIKTQDTKNKQKDNPHHHYEGVYKESDNIDRPPTAVAPPPSSATTPSSRFVKSLLASTTTVSPNGQIKSAEVFEDVVIKLKSLGDRGKKVLDRIVTEIDRIEIQDAEGKKLKESIGSIMSNDTLSEEDKKRLKRQVILGSPILNSFMEDTDPDEDAAIEKEDLYPDGIAQDRGTVNETTLNDRSNSEFWSSFSSSEERLLQCKGLILNLPLTPHIHCSPKFESQHASASMANTVTYRVPTDGYYFFVFNSENEVQANFVRIRFDLMKTVYDTSDPVHFCKNSTDECALPFSFFSQEKTVLELPVNGNDSQWNEEYVVVSTCEPRTSIYLICIISVPVLILIFAFH